MNYRSSLGAVQKLSMVLIVAPTNLLPRYSVLLSHNRPPRGTHKETSIVFFDVADAGMTAAQMAERLAEHGVRVGAVYSSGLRAVTHLDITTAQVEEAAAAVKAVVEGV